MVLTASVSQFHRRECKKLQKESVCLPLRFFGHVNNVYKSTREHDDVYEFSWHDSGRFVPRPPRHWFHPRRSLSQNERMHQFREFLFWSWKGTYQSCWCWGSLRLMILHKASLVFQRMSGQSTVTFSVTTRHLDLISYNTFSTLTTDWKSSAVSFQSHSSPI